jgi:hypothetical protein
MSYGATGEDVERELTRHAQDCVRLVDSCEIEIVCELCPEAIAAQKHAIEVFLSSLQMLQIYSHQIVLIRLSWRDTRNAGEWGVEES